MMKILSSVPLQNTTIQDPLWGDYAGLVDTVVLPYMWELINDRVEGAEKSWCIRNFRIAAGLETGHHHGAVFQDTDVYKWLEAVAYSLANTKNEKLEETADLAIDLIAKAQCDDGYVNTYYTITGDERWSDLQEGHELYSAGHMFEAAVAYYDATGKRKFLDTACRFADYLCAVFGKGEGQIPGYPGHPEVEVGLVRLCRATGEKKYLDLADYFIRIRGEQPCYFLSEKCRHDGNYIFPEFRGFGMDYMQADKPLSEQTEAQGHAVRAGYLYSAMADLAAESGDAALLEQCKVLWNDIVTKKMYLTGGIGSAAYGERFTASYDLPNAANYSESCASISLAMFSNRMFRITREGKYTDIVELALYNTVLAGIAMDGKSYFYVNPLQVNPDIAEKNPGMSHVKTERQKWFGVACCPPNIARTIENISEYAFAAESGSFYLNLFLSGSCKVEDFGVVEIKADYPRSGHIEVIVKEFSAEKTPDGAAAGISPSEAGNAGEAAGGENTAGITDSGIVPGKPYRIALRLPAYCSNRTIRINGTAQQICEESGYAILERTWQAGDRIELDLEIPMRYVYCNPKVDENIGCCAIMKGPWVFCLEEADNGKHLASIFADTDAPIEESGTQIGSMQLPKAVFSGKKAVISETDQEALYAEKRPAYESGTFTAIPYFAWNNRGRGEMTVWVKDLRQP